MVQSPRYQVDRQGKSELCAQGSRVRSAVLLTALVLVATCGVFLLGAATQESNSNDYRSVYQAELGEKFGILFQQDGGSVDLSLRFMTGWMIGTLIHVGADYLHFRMEERGDRYIPLSMARLWTEPKK